MNLTNRSIRWLGIVAAGACAAVLVPAVALAAPGDGGRTTAATAPARQCLTRNLVEWINTQGSGTAGAVVYQLHFTNLSAQRCALNGFPRVAAVDLSGNRLGSPASRGAGTGRRVIVRSDRTVRARLQIEDVGNFPLSACRPVTAAGLRVRPPNRMASKVIPFPFGACSQQGSAFLIVGPVRR